VGVPVWNLTDLKKFVFSKGFLVPFSLVFGVLVAVGMTMCVNKEFFFLVVGILSTTISLMIFCVYCLTPVPCFNGFVLVVGVGFLGMAFLTVTFSGAVAGFFGSDSSNIAFQVVAWARVYQYTIFNVGALLIGCNWNKGKSMLFAFLTNACFVGLLLTVIFTSLLPAEWNSHGNSSVYRYTLITLSALLLLTMSILFINKRHSFSVGVWVFLMLANLACIGELGIFAYHKPGVHWDSLILRMLSFYFLFVAIVFMSLNDPLNNLFRFCEEQEKNSQIEQMFSEWMEHVPAMVILLNSKRVGVYPSETSEQFVEDDQE